MSTSPTIDLRFGGYIASVPTVSVLRNTVDPTQYIKGDSIIVLGNADISDGRGGVYAWLPDATADDDNYDVIAPVSGAGHPGRWVLAVGPTPELAALVLAVGNEQSVRQNADSSLAASIHTEQIVRTTADEALAQRTTTLEASFTSHQGAIDGLANSLATSNARITDEATVRASADQALASRTLTLEVSHTEQQNSLNNLTTNLTTANGRIEDESTVRATADQALASRTTTLESDFTTQQGAIGGLLTDLTSAKASITDEASTRAAADSALASRTTTLEAGFSGHQTSLDGLTSGLATANAKVTDEATARADADSALAQRTTTLESNYSNQQNAINATNASLSTEQTARSDADGALASQITTLIASTNSSAANLSARLSDEASARTNADQALASRASNLEATAGNLTSRVSVTESAVANLAGKGEAYWKVEAVSGSNRAQLSIHADANGGAGVDIVGDVTISGNLVVDGTLNTGKLSNGAITGYYQGYNSISYRGAGTGYQQTLVSYNVHMDFEGDILLWATATQSYGSTDGLHPWNMSVWVDSGSYGSSGGGTAVTDSASTSGRAHVGPGDHTVELRWIGHSAITINPGSASIIAMRAYK